MKIEKVLGFGSQGMVYFGRMWDHKVVVKLIEHGAGLLGKEQNRGKLARIEVGLWIPGGLGAGGLRHQPPTRLACTDTDAWLQPVACSSSRLCPA